MRICDKCGKALRKGDGSSHIELGYAFIYDVCEKCEENFLLHVSSFFNKSKEKDNADIDKTQSGQYTH